MFCFILLKSVNTCFPIPHVAFCLFSHSVLQFQISFAVFQFITAAHPSLPLLLVVFSVLAHPPHLSSTLQSEAFFYNMVLKTSLPYFKTFDKLPLCPRVKAKFPLVFCLTFPPYSGPAFSHIQLLSPSIDSMQLQHIPKCGSWTTCFRITEILNKAESWVTLQAPWIQNPRCGYQ